MKTYQAKPMGGAKPMTALDAASGTGMAFLTSELEKLDPMTLPGILFCLLWLIVGIALVVRLLGSLRIWCSVLGQ